ncbi:hypothetical protein GCM10007391_13470 [Alteromonas halophila]|uniref:Uncharacterized protein n=1 Tax=Alteromonas halophila TaxID=516698 RepID=A0A918MX74_9ALTE|nr:hypothetical protein GCM10007391_13470 [Alteromonas halophila]
MSAFAPFSFIKARMPFTQTVRKETLTFRYMVPNKGNYSKCLKCSIVKTWKGYTSNTRSFWEDAITSIITQRVLKGDRPARTFSDDRTLLTLRIRA